MKTSEQCDDLLPLWFKNQFPLNGHERDSHAPNLTTLLAKCVSYVSELIATKPYSRLIPTPKSIGPKNRNEAPILEVADNPGSVERLINFKPLLNWFDLAFLELEGGRLEGVGGNEDLK